MKRFVTTTYTFSLFALFWSQAKWNENGQFLIAMNLDIRFVILLDCETALKEMKLYFSIGYPTMNWPRLDLDYFYVRLFYLKMILMTEILLILISHFRIKVFTLSCYSDLIFNQTVMLKTSTSHFHAYFFLVKWLMAVMLYSPLLCFFECAYLMSGVMLPFMCSYQSQSRPLIVLIGIWNYLDLFY